MDLGTLSLHRLQRTLDQRRRGLALSTTFIAFVRAVFVRTGVRLPAYVMFERRTRRLYGPTLLA